MTLFATFEEVREITSLWLQAYNEVRPYDVLSDIPPSAYATRIAGNSYFKPVALTGKLMVKPLHLNP